MRFRVDHYREISGIIGRARPIAPGLAEAADQNLRKSAPISPRRISGLRFVFGFERDNFPPPAIIASIRNILKISH